MPTLLDVTAYLEQHQLESELSEAVTACVEDEVAQPLAKIAELLAARAAELCVGFDYAALVGELQDLVAARAKAGELLVPLSWHDTAAFGGAGWPNAAMERIAGSGSGGAGPNAGLPTAPLPLLEPLKKRHPRISRADLAALAANVSIKAMGGPKIQTRFGRRDATSLAAHEPEPALRPAAARGARDAGQLRRVFAPLGFSDRDIVALSGAHTVGKASAERSGYEGAWTPSPLRFDGQYYAELLHKSWAEAEAASGKPVLACATSPGALMLLSDGALLDDAAFRALAETYAADQAKWFADFGSAWTKLQELGCSELRPHPAALTYASAGCAIPAEWLDLPLLARREYNHDSTVYTFGLPTPTTRLGLPICACLLVRAPGKGRGIGGKDDWDGSDAVRPYTPMSDDGMVGRFELLVKRYAGGAVSTYLHGLPLGARVGFKHISFNVKRQYPFEGKRSFTMLCAGSGITPMYQALWKLLGTPGDDRKVTLLYSNKTPADILLKEELDGWARLHPGKLTLVHVVGDGPRDAPPPGWATTAEYTAESGWIDAAKIELYAHAPCAETLVFVCGLPPMYASLCGPRDEKGLREGSVLHQLGYTADMVAKM